MTNNQQINSSEQSGEEKSSPPFNLKDCFVLGPGKPAVYNPYRDYILKEMPELSEEEIA